MKFSKKLPLFVSTSFYCTFFLTALLCFSKPKKTTFIIPNSKNLSDRYRKTKKNLSFPIITNIFISTFHIKRGEYSGGSNLQLLLNMLLNKQVMRKITFPEGMSSVQIYDTLKEREDLTGEIKHTPEEGTLYNSTYVYTLHSDRNQLIRKMEEEFVKASEDIFKNSYSIWKNKKDWITFASIIEKEGKEKEEKEKIASVFLNRIKRGMKFESCATVLYFKTQGKYNLNKLMFKDLLEKNPFNTYRNKGLPPKPITNPSVESLLIALNPKPTENLFFFIRDNKTIFSKRFSNHVKKKSKQNSKNIKTNKQNITP
ncbi:endolytic transglycosylase MltG [Candidatus Nesciobacter abundans]|uniref:Endolytic transglycosylase MltG n=1 Tax=Candidatus Nesciobacter abundans TaxID=2601668 RepID=A0A5C0UID7_9PROT|nr:endolytic transglycosylase MltG [Candidatus Nesciobacter abundans]QEK39273.1 endolytic transglycosylase MltG [Candidatus Nesciobacter abundans]